MWRSHHWARLSELGHDVRLMPPQYVKAYVKRNKNDAADAEAICEAMSRPTMRFVPVKTAEQQAALMLPGRATGWSAADPACNAIRGYAAEFGTDCGQRARRMKRCWRGSHGRDAAGTGAGAVCDLGEDYAQLTAIAAIEPG